MGGTQSKNKPRRPRKSTKNVTEMVDVNFFSEEYAEEQYIEITECCGMKFTKILKRIEFIIQGKSSGKTISLITAI